MTTRASRLLASAGAAAFVVGGVALEGTRGNPANFFIVWMFSTTALDIACRRSSSVLRWIGAAAVFAASLVGLIETLGVDHASSLGGGMICFGLVLGVIAGAESGPFARRSAAEPGDAPRDIGGVRSKV